MFAEIGHLALLLALAASILQSTAGLAGAHRNDAPLMAVGRAAAGIQFLLLALALGCLIHAYLISDFSVANVAANSSTAKPLLYKITGAWGNHEGSMLLWAAILALFGACVAVFGVSLPAGLRSRVLGVQGLLGLAFLLFIALTSNPFDRLVPAPVEGRGLNPILQDPGLAFHPPLLYLGYVGFSVTFSFAVAALLEGKVDAAWARWVRPWALAAWGFLTVGIALGSWWAYYELGWGGWWFWDPVENASFMPWLVGTALLHSAIVVEKRDALKSWTVLLAILTFSLSLLGTFLVRSGVLTSVHTFANDPARGIFILMILAVTIGGALTLYAIRAPTLKGGGLFRPASREGAMVLNNLLMATAAATVLLGTLYPLVLDVLGGGRISVGSPYFNATFIPLMAPMLLAMGVAGFLPWKRADLSMVWGRMRLVFVVTVVACLATLALTNWTDFLATLGFGLAAWLLAGTLFDLAERIRLFRAPIGQSLRRATGLPRSAWGMTIAHSAAGLMVLGITASSSWQTERITYLKSGQSLQVAAYQVTFTGVRLVRGPNYTARQGRFEARRGGRLITVLIAEKRSYPRERQTTTEAAIHSTLGGDLYVVLGDPDKKGGWAVRMYFNPLVAWIWIGAILMFVGAGVSLTDRRYRIGAPHRARKSPQPAISDAT
jgi:cytochrome c-type biogenesis protein CcmF